MAKKDYDFSGWATKFGIKCSDGVTIAKGAFAEDNGKTVSMVYMHNHKDLDNVIGHAVLETRDEGVYAYCKMNNSERGQLAKELVKNGDLTSMSIFATQLKKASGNVVTHGSIKELSLVLAGANPGACIVEPIVHADAAFSEDNFEATIYNDEDDFVMHSEEGAEDNQDSSSEEVAEDNQDVTSSEGDENLEHADEKDETLGDIVNSMTDKQKLAAVAWITAALEQSGVELSDDASDVLTNMLENLPEDIEIDETETIKDIVDTMSDKQKEAVELIIGLSVPEEADNKEDVQHSEELENTENLQHNEEENSMKNNVFDNQNQGSNEGYTLSHSDIAGIIATAKSNGSLKEAAKNFADSLSHAEAGTITDVNKLFPEATLIGEKPAVIIEDTSWVSSVINGVKKSPFAKVKTIAVDVTSENARAKGYVKGNQKTEDVMLALKRSHDPQTVYVKTKMDRDDILDITDFDIVAFKKSEMRIKLDEEIGRAILTGDGRSVDSPDKIFPAHIQPILGDSATYVTANVAALITDEDADVQAQKNAKAFIKKVRRSRRDYKGSGKPVMYIDSVLLDELLLIEDKNERFIYETEESLARVLRVSKIIPVEYFGTVTRTADNKTFTLQAIMVNLTDYTIGANKGGNVSLFEDFDINFNQQLYLIETRCSGALTKPFSAITYETYTEQA